MDSFERLPQRLDAADELRGRLGAAMAALARQRRLRQTLVTITALLSVLSWLGSRLGAGRAAAWAWLGLALLALAAWHAERRSARTCDALSTRLSTLEGSAWTTLAD